MVSRQIIQFKCVVNVCDQDFGAFCRERGLTGKKRFGEQPGATKPAPGDGLEALVEVSGLVGWAGGLVLDVLGMLGTWVCPWMAVVTLWEWLWWRWRWAWAGGKSDKQCQHALCGRMR